jgi:ABC-type glutathione transport system ATPase component
MTRLGRSAFEALSVVLSRGLTFRKETILGRGASSASVAETNNGAPPLEARSVFAGYGVTGRKRPYLDVLRDVTLSIARGELVVVIGPNGAGKSTLLRVLSGTLRAHAGTARLFGQDIAELPRREVARRVSCRR